MLMAIEKTTDATARFMAMTSGQATARAGRPV
jgi:hypothetical protein